MKKYYCYIKLCLIALIALFLYSFAGRKNSGRTIQKPEIEFSSAANLFLTHTDVDDLLKSNGKHIKGQAKGAVEVMQLEAQVERHPMVSEAEVSVGVDGDVKVEVTQREPIARLLQDGKVQYMDRKGLLMPLSKVYSARVPIVVLQAKDTAYKKVFQLMHRIENDAFLKQNCTQVRKVGKVFTLVTREGNQNVVLGDLSNIQEKIQKMKAFYQFGKADTLAQQYRKIDLQYRNQVVCSK